MSSLFDSGAGGRKGAPGNQAVLGSTFVRLTRTWKAGDVVELALPKRLHLETTPDNHQVAAVMWGPLALAGDLGPRIEGPGAARNATPAPMLVAADRPADTWVLPAGARAGDFVAKQVGALASNAALRTDLSLTPFHRTHRRRYGIYHDVLTDREFAARVASYSAEQERIKRLEAATVSSVVPGDRQGESTYNYKSEPADRRAERNDGRQSRGGTGWFSYDLMVEPTSEMALVVTYFNELGLPPTQGNFEVKVEGATIAKFEPNAAATGFYDARYAVPEALVTGKARVTVRFEAVGSGRIAPVYGIRLIRARDVQ